MDEKRLQKVIIVIVCLVLIRGLIYSLLIPFDRSPDENYYFNLIKAKQLQLSHASIEEQQRVAAQYELTRTYLLYPESTKKRSLQDFAGAELSEPPSSSNIYYLVTAWLLKVLALENIRDEIYVIRGFSVLCSMVVVFMSFLVAREIFPENVFLFIGSPVFITFVPQFSAMGGVVNNNKLTEVFVSLLFWLVVKVFKHGMNKVYISAYILTMVFALLSKQTAVFMLPFFVVFLLVYYWKSSLGFKLHLVLIAMFVGVLFGGSFLRWCLDEKEFFLIDYFIWVPPHKLIYFLSHGFSSEYFKYYAKFFIVIYWSFWGVFGYMTIHLHHFWYLLGAFFQSLSLFGLFRVIWQVKMRKISIETWKTKVLYLFVMSIVLGVFMMFFRSIILRPKLPFLAQGRRLFTVIIPISLLTLFGLGNLFPRKYYPWIACIGIIGLIILDSVCLSNYILLNFHRLSLF